MCFLFFSIFPFGSCGRFPNNHYNIVQRNPSNDQLPPCTTHYHRYGPPNEQLELGKVSPGTYCTRQFDECYRKKCRLQSPNYPGMYPRNVTCYWTIRQKVVPTCKHALVAVSQEDEHKALVKR